MTTCTGPAGVAGNLLALLFLAWCCAMPARAAPGTAAPVPTAEPASRQVSGVLPVPASGSVPATARPRIGLVLSGGGARGGAHIGVLKVLEELRVPIDMIVGTSAGAIVGAAYASGMRTTDIEREMRTLSTASLFHDVARRDLSIARKADDAGGYVGPEIGVGTSGVSLPKGAVSGVALEAVLRRLTVRQPSSDFDLLPVPFRAVATDVASGDMVVLEHGNLAQAIRASMAIPAVVNPVDIEGRLLVDGGVARNLPVDVARAMGADIVIAVNIGTPLLRREEITSVLSISEQMTRMLTAANTRASLKELTPRDVLITPAMDDLNAASFDRLEEAEAAGEIAGLAAAAQLRRYALSGQDYAALAAVRAGEPPHKGVLLNAVRIDGAQRVPEAALLGIMTSKPGQLFDPERAERDMRRLFGRGDFEHVSYALNPLDGGGHAMTTTVNEKSWGPQYLRLGVGFSTDFEGDSFFSLRAVHRWTWLNSLGAEWRNDVAIGHTDRLRTEFLQPLTPAQRLFASARLAAERTPLDIYDDGKRLARYRRESVSAGLDLGAPLAEWGEARVGVSRGHVRMLRDTSFLAGSLVFPRVREAGLQLRVRADTLDNLAFPRSGAEADLQIYSSRTALGADSNYNKLSFSGKTAAALGPHSLQARLEVQSRLGGGELPDSELISYGGFLRLSGYNTGELLGKSLHFSSLVYNYRLSRPGLLDGAFIGVSTELGRMAHTIAVSEGEQTVRSNAVYVAVDTPLGPLYLGAGQASRGKRAVYLLIGKP